MATTISIAGTSIGADAAPYVIAEIGINHGGNVDTALAMIDAAAAAGASAVKLQAYRTHAFLAHSSPYFDILAGAELSADKMRVAMAHACAKDIVLFASVFDEASADLMADLGAAAFKVASGDITHLPLLERIGTLSTPVIVSTGGATLDETDAALAALRKTDPDLPVAILHCVSHYPTAPEEANLACMAGLRDRYEVPVGFSDHTLGSAIALAAIALGADVLEKHFTYDSNAPGLDHALSVDQHVLKALVDDARAVKRAIGNRNKAPVESAEHIVAIRRGVTAARDIAAGAIVCGDDLAVKRPAAGLAPARRDSLIGRAARSAIAADTPMTDDLLD